MKGYTTAGGYMGYVDGEYILFACEADYLEYVFAWKKNYGILLTHTNKKIGNAEEIEKK